MNKQFLKEEMLMAIECIEEMFNIPGHKENVNQNDIVFPICSIRMTFIETTNYNKCW
jgi:hypothetical protein